MYIKKVVGSIFLLLLVSIGSALAGECGNLKNDDKMLLCFNNKIKKLKNNTYKLVSTNKRLKKDQLDNFKKALKYWEISEKSFCQYLYLSGISKIDALNQSACMLEQWQHRLELTKKDLDEITPHKVIYKDVPNGEDMQFKNIVEKYRLLMNYLYKVSYDKNITSLRSQALDTHITNWQQFAITYARIHNWQQTLQELIEAKKNIASQQLTELKSKNKK